MTELEKRTDKKSAYKDLSIELTRIIACFFVICIHLDLGFEIGGEISKSEIYLACLRADAVGMFWLIAGMHFFKERPYRSVLKNMARRIVFPVLVLMGVLFYFSEWIIGNQTLLENLSHSGSEYAAFFKTLFLEWVTPVPHSGQLWYIFVYILLCFVQPVGVALLKYLNTERRQKVFCLVSFSFLVLNDISQNHFGDFSHHTFGAAVPAFVIMIWGRLLYDHREIFRKKLNIILLSVFFLGINLFRCFIQLFISTHQENASRFILYWYTSIGLCCAIAVYFLCMFFTERIRTGGMPAKCIEFAGGLTFSVYLLHMFIKDLLVNKGFSEFVMNRVSGIHNVLMCHGLYYLIFGSVIFIICLGIGIVVRGGKSWIRSLF